MIGIAAERLMALEPTGSSWTGPFLRDAGAPRSSDRRFAEADGEARAVENEFEEI